MGVAQALLLLRWLIVHGGGCCAARIIFAPFGYALRAGARLPAAGGGHRPQRRPHNWLAFIIAGAAAGLAGGLYAYFKGSVFPTYWRSRNPSMRC